MADHFYGVNRGFSLTPNSVTAGTSTGATDIELRVADGASLTQKEVVQALEVIRVFITSRLNTTAPPN